MHCRHHSFTCTADTIPLPALQTSYLYLHCRHHSFTCTADTIPLPAVQTAYLYLHCRHHSFTCTADTIPLPALQTSYLYLHCRHHSFTCTADTIPARARERLLYHSKIALHFLLLVRCHISKKEKNKQQWLIHMQLHQKASHPGLHGSLWKLFS